MEAVIAGVKFTKIENSYFPGEFNWVSEDINIPFLGNKLLQIETEFTDEEFDKYQPEIEKTLKGVLSLNGNDRENIKKHLFAYYKDFVSDVGEECLEDMPPLDNDEDILRYIGLSELSISQDFSNKKFYAFFTGHCDWEIEHGLAISFKDGNELARVGGHSGHITNSDERFIYEGSSISTFQE